MSGRTVINGDAIGGTDGCNTDWLMCPFRLIPAIPQSPHSSDSSVASFQRKLESTRILDPSFRWDEA
jgi:hypothetical protein